MMLVYSVKVGRVGKSDVLAYIIRRYQSLTDEEKEEFKKTSTWSLKNKQNSDQIVFIKGYF